MEHAAAIIRFALELAEDKDIQYQIVEDGTDGYEFTATGPQSFQIQAGSERGVLYAVYDIVNGINNGRGRPAFSIRGLNPCESLARHNPQQIRQFLERMGKWRMNTLIIHSEYGYQEHKALITEEAGKRGIELVFYTYYNLAFCDDIPQEHFAKNANGLPKPLGSKLECVDRLCASDPEGLNLYKEGVDNYLEQHSDHQRLMLATSDGFNYCECESCRDKSPIAQWEPFFNHFFDESQDRKKEALIYLNRFSLPTDLTRIKQLDRIMFDTHLRYRRESLQLATKPQTQRDLNEEQVDPRAKNIPINNYLLDRLKEWRAAYPGKLYLFENLMIQGIFGLCWPNTSIYLEDIKTLYREGIDGIVYEAFEPGIQSFLPLFDRIAEALWDPEKAYEAGPFEQEYLRDLSGSEWPGNGHWKAYYHELPNLSLHILVDQFKSNPTWQTAKILLTDLLARPDCNDFDWLYIGFTSMRYVHLNIEPSTATDPMEKMFLNSTKLWDFMNKVDYPRETVGKLIHQIVGKL